MYAVLFFLLCYKTQAKTTLSVEKQNEVELLNWAGKEIKKIRPIWQKAVGKKHKTIKRKMENMKILKIRPAISGIIKNSNRLNSIKIQRISNCILKVVSFLQHMHLNRNMKI